MYGPSLSFSQNKLRFKKRKQWSLFMLSTNNGYLGYLFPVLPIFNKHSCVNLAIYVCIRFYQYSPRRKLLIPRSLLSNLAACQS